MKKAFLLVLLLHISGSAQALSYLGDLRQWIRQGLSAFRDRSISHTDFDPAMAPGTVAENVNLFTGQPTFQVPLGQLSVRGRLGWSLQLNYVGGTKQVIAKNNEKTPTGWVGLGWDFSMPSVSVNHRGTFRSNDDVVYCNLGPYGGGQIVAGAGNTFFVSTNPNITVRVEKGTTAGEAYFQQIKTWTFIFPDGNRMVFGDNENSRRTVQYNGTRIVSSAFVLADQPFIYRWDLSRFSDFDGANTLQFGYQQFKEPSPSSNLYTRESHPSYIHWLNPFGQSVQKVEFVLEDKSETGYKGYPPMGNREDQLLFEKKRLKQLNFFEEGVKVRSAVLFYQTGTHGKDRLEDLHVNQFNNKGVKIHTSNWDFQYSASFQDMLGKVVKPDGSFTEFVYKAFAPESGSEADQEVGARTMMKTESGEVTPIEVGDGNNWSIEGTCNERFCWKVARDIPNNRMHIEVFHNAGNYFREHPEFRETFQVSGTSAAQWSFYMLDNYFLIADRKHGAVDLWEWDGLQFVKRDSQISYFQDGNNFAGEIEVYPQPNYILILKKNGSKMYVAVKDSESGMWRLENETSSCGYANNGDYGEVIRDDAGACLDWNTADLKVLPNPNYFVVAPANKDIFNIFAFNGSTFQEISSSLPDIGIQKIVGTTVYTMNWQRNFEALLATPEMLVVESNLNTQDRIDVLYYDGKSFHHSGTSGLIDDGNNGLGRAFMPSSGYFLEVNRSGGAAHVWLKREAGGGIMLVRQAPLPFSFNGGNVIWTQIHPEAIFLEEHHAAYPGHPVAVSGSDRYKNAFYEIKSGQIQYFRDRTLELPSFANHILLSASEDAVIWEVLYKNVSGSSQTCLPENSCIQYPQMGHLKPSIGSNFEPAFLLAKETAFKFWFQGARWFIQNVARPSPDRLAQATIIDNVSHRILFSLAQYDGRYYDKPESQPVVDKVVQSAGVLGNSSLPQERVVQFGYGTSSFGDGSPDGLEEFNCNTLMPQFHSSWIKNLGARPSNSPTLGGLMYSFYLDSRYMPLSGFNINSQGTVSSTQTYQADSKVMNATSNTQISYRASEWPEAIRVNRPDSVGYTEYDSVINKQHTLTHYLQYNDKNGQPALVIQELPTEYLVQENLFGQKQLDGVTFLEPSQSIQYRFAKPLSIENFANPSLWQVLRGTGQVIGSSRQDFLPGFPFLAYRGYRWRDIDERHLGTGYSPDEPQFNLDENWVQVSEATFYNGYHQLQESKTLRGEGAETESFGATLYEGARSQPVAQFSQVKHSNVAAFLAENGPGLGHQEAARNGWEIDAATLTFDPGQVRSGRYSARVEDSYGPTKKVFLKDVVAEGFDYKVSVWMYSNGAAPVLAVERRMDDGSAFGSQVGQTRWTNVPVDGAFVPNKWQRYELVVKNPELVGTENLFTVPIRNDHLRIWAGTGTPTGNASRVAYVDDFVACPTHTSYTLTTYDFQGAPLTVQDMHHSLQFYERDVFGSVIGIRNRDYRIYSQSAQHLAGEHLRD